MCVCLKGSTLEGAVFAHKFTPEGSRVDVSVDVNISELIHEGLNIICVFLHNGNMN